MHDQVRKFPDGGIVIGLPEAIAPVDNYIQVAAPFLACWPITKGIHENLPLSPPDGWQVLQEISIQVVDVPGIGALCVHPRNLWQGGFQGRQISCSL